MVSHTAELTLAALNQALDAVVFIDENNLITYFNAAAEHLFGYGRAEVMGRNVACLVPPELRAQHDGFIAEHRRTGRDRIVGTSREVSIERKDGTRLWGLLSLSRTLVGEAVYYSAFIHNVTEEVRRREELRILSLVADETGQAVLVTDGAGQILYVNRAFTELFGYGREELSGKRPLEFLSGRDDEDAVRRRLYQRMKAGIGFTEEVLCRDKAGRDVWISASVNAVIDRSTGAVTNFVAVLTDVTENKQMEALQRDVLSALAAGVPLEDVAELICRKVEAIIAGVVCSFIAVTGEGRLLPVAAPSLPEAFVTAIAGASIGPDAGSCASAAFRGEPVVVTDIAASPLWSTHRDAPMPDDLVACWSLPITTSREQVAGIFALYFKEKRTPSAWHEHIMETCIPLCALALERSETRAHIARLAYADTLTGLPNRSRLVEELASAIAEAQESGAPLALLCLDVDHFKDVNDTLGHSTGDQILLELSRRLKVHLRGADMVARIGGDEFVILLKACEADEAAQIAGRLLEYLAAPIGVHGLQLTMSASIGIALCPAHGSDAEALLKHGDTAMFEAKRDGRGKFHFFTEDLDRKVQSRLVLGVALREAILRHQLQLSFQPQVAIDSGQIFGVEALTRWSDPVHGDVPPTRFIALAEEYGLIDAIDHWAIEETCRLIARWRAEKLDVPHVSVNVSPVSFRSNEVVEVITKALADNGLQPSDLRVEITERVMMDQHPNSLATARAIEALGVHLAMDDFGTGYSSLSSLAQLPIAELKIDRSFMLALEEDANAQALATAVIRIGQSLGMTVVAEGVETKAQLAMLGELKCHAAQGYLFSRPLNAGEFEEWLRRRAAPESSPETLRRRSGA